MFFDNLSDRCQKIGSVLCIGLDPRFDSVPADPLDEIVAKNRRIVESTSEYAAAYKPNSAFYEQFGIPGMKALKQTIDLIPDEIPVILDAKRGDIGSTSAAYAKAVYDWLGADAVTLSPYLGREAIAPFLERSEKGCIILCRTSNVGSDVFQGFDEADPKSEPLYIHVARECASWGDNVGLVVAGNKPEALRAVRERTGSTWFLAPGIGAQGGDAGEAVSAGARDDGLGLLVSVSRSVSEADDPGEAALALRDEIETVRNDRTNLSAPSRREPLAAPDADSGLREKLLLGIIECGAFRTGRFELKSGMESPFYIDLRLVPSNPELFEIAGACYAELLAPLTCNQIAGIPTAGLPLGAAAAIAARKPMIYPRLDAKSYGGKRRVEGSYSAGDRVVLLDDLITTGGSKIEASEVIRAEGLIVEDLVVLIERGTAGRKDLEEAGIELHAYATIHELFDLCRKLGRVSEEEYRNLVAFVA